MTLSILARRYSFWACLVAAGLSGSATAQPGTGGAPIAATPAASNAAAARLIVQLPRIATHLKKNGKLKIVAFGSSSTAGTGASTPSNTYPALLENDLEEGLRLALESHPDITVVNRGRGGDDAVAMAERLDRDVLAEKPDLVIWQTGSNDPLRGVPVEHFAELTRRGITAIRASGADLILMDQQWCQRLSSAANAKAYGDALHAVATEAGVPVIRRHDMMQAWVARGLLTPTQMIGPDGLHMTDAGYRQLAKSAAAQILVGAGLIQQPSPAQN